MAHGKSLELAKIGPAKPKVKCLCGDIWDNHLRKDGQVMVKYRGEDHGAMQFQGFNRKARRSFRRMNNV